jgi:hypothetical protein
VDATAPVDSGGDARDGADAGADVPVLTCSSGYFVEVAFDDGTTWFYRDGCMGGMVPARACVSGGEDCLTTGIVGCDNDASVNGGSSATLAYEGCACGALMVGTAPGRVTLVGEALFSTGNAEIDVTAVGTAAAVGTFTGTLTSGGMFPIHGAFCVRP